MPIRSLDLLDLPVITRYRNDILLLDSARALTRGHPFGAIGLLSYINPNKEMYAAVLNGGKFSLIGGIIHTRGESFAKLLYLAPSSRLDDPKLPALIEHLTFQAGLWEAFHVLAEVDESSEVFRALRLAGFSVYVSQVLWDVSMLEKTEPASRSDWRRMSSEDLPAVQSLHYQIVPPLMHPVEPAPNRVVGFVHSENKKCYANITVGAYGIVLTPFIHPEEDNVSEKLSELVASLPNRRGRPVYFCIRSYQTWLEPILEELGAKASQRQVVMEKHLARLVKEEQLVRAVPSNAKIQPSRISRMDAND